MLAKPAMDNKIFKTTIITMVCGYLRTNDEHWMFYGRHSLPELRNINESTDRQTRTLCVQQLTWQLCMRICQCKHK